MSKQVCALLRASQFSPNSEEKDLAIMQEVCRRLRESDIVVTEYGECDIKRIAGAHVHLWLSMARSHEAMDFLMQREKLGECVINPPLGVLNARRWRIQELMHECGTPLPPEEGSRGYWLKRADGAAKEQADVVYAPDKETLHRQMLNFKARGMDQWVVSSHVEGDVVKFYGVEPTGFFRVFYPSDDGMTKFGHEAVNGPARHFHFSIERLKYEVEKVARKAHLPVYGGDAIVTESGDFAVVDFNDWPSFARCREEAAEHIAQYAYHVMLKGNDDGLKKEKE